MADRMTRKIRSNIKGSAKRPRLAVFRSLNNISAQIIDDSTGHTLASASSLKLKGKLTEKAVIVGEAVANLAKEKKIKMVVFDRSGYAYHGAVQILADTARSKGLEF